MSSTTRWVSSCVSASAITRTSGSVPLRAHQGAAAAVKFLLGGSDGIPDGLAIVQTSLVVGMHVDEYLRVLLHDTGKIGEGATGALEHGQQLQSRHQAVTGGVVLQEDDVAGLFAADDGAVREHALQNVAGRPAVWTISKPCSFIAMGSPGCT